MSGVPYGTVCRLLSKEDYTPNLQTLKDLAKALDMSIDDIVGLSETPEAAEQPSEEENLPSETVPAEQPDPAGPEEAAEAVVSSAIRAYEMLLEERQKELDAKDLWLHRLFILCCILVGVIIAVLIFDLLNPSVGFFRS